MEHHPCDVFYALQDIMQAQAMSIIIGSIETTDCRIQGIKCDTLDTDEA